jgi:hypothetical protein
VQAPRLSKATPSEPVVLDIAKPKQVEPLAARAAADSPADSVRSRA